MSTIDILLASYEFNRTRSLALLEQIELESNVSEVLGWRPGEKRAHIAWQLMHVGISEDIFAIERLAPEKSSSLTELWPRFRGGSTPDDQIPSPDEIRRVLATGRQELGDTLANFCEEDLAKVPETWTERGLTLLQILHILGYHEAHHHGQAHITLNLYKASHS